MKFEKLKGTGAEKVGDIKSNVVSIDKKNLDWIVRILSTNLYSNPIKSFLRETVSNAWDSHIEAGIDEPVIIELGKDSEDQWFCKIQDVGVGISPERFNLIYKMIGSSTKREDENQIGGFGIGRFSALAVSDVVYITSVYDEVEYKYLMHREFNKISIDLLSEVDKPDSRNGVTVFVPIKSSQEVHKFSSAIKDQICFFENIFVVMEEGTGLYSVKSQVDEINNSVIKEYKNFSVCSISHNMGLLRGKVKYPLRFENIEEHPDYVALREEFNSLTTWPICLRFTVQELEIAPDREELMYTPETVQEIVSKMKLAYQEVMDMARAQCNVDCKTLLEYYNKVASIHTLELLPSTPSSSNIKITFPSHFSDAATLQGKKYNHKLFTEAYRVVQEFGIHCPYYLIGGHPGKITYQSNTHYTAYRNLRDIIAANKCFRCDVKNLKNITKSFIRETFPSGTYFLTEKVGYVMLGKRYVSGGKPLALYPEFNARVYGHLLSSIYSRHEVKNLLDMPPSQTKNLKLQIRSIAKFAFKEMKATVNTVPLFTDADVDSKWAKDRAEKQKVKRLAARQARGHLYDKEAFSIEKLRMAYTGWGDVTYDSETVTRNYFKKIKKLYVYSVKKDKLIEHFHSLFTYYEKIEFIRVAPNKAKFLEEIPNVINLKTFMSQKQRLMRRVATAMLINKRIPFVSMYANMDSIKNIHRGLFSAALTLHQYQHKTLEAVYSYRRNKNITYLTEDIYLMCERYNFFDGEILGLINKYESLFEKAKVLLLFNGNAQQSLDNLKAGKPNASASDIPEARVNVITDYLIARKIFRPDHNAWKRLKEETIFNLKPIDDDKNNS